MNVIRTKSTTAAMSSALKIWAKDFIAVLGRPCVTASIIFSRLSFAGFVCVKARGQKIYNERCYICHGYSGDANTLAASYLNPRPRAFTQTNPAKLSREKMIDAVTHGRPNTAMKSFAQILSADDIAAVVDFVRITFMEKKGRNTAYHTPENGWPNHQRYAAAFPFALGEIPLDTPWE